MDWIEYGIERGKKEGKNMHVIKLVCKKLQKGLGVRQIAEDLEEEESLIETICKVAEAFGPDYDISGIYDALHQ